MLADRTPDAASRQLVRTLGTVTSCVTLARPTVAPHDGNSGNVSVAEFPAAASLRSPAGGPAGLLLDIAYGFEVVEAPHASLRQRWQVATRMYEYSLLDHDHTELLAYHWQPGPDFDGPDHPHVHISAALDARVDAVTRREIGLDKLHIATGHVFLTAFVRMLITEFGVAPLRHDWRETLDRVEAEAALD